MMTQKEKLLHNIAAKYIMSEDIDIELTGRPAEMDCLVSLLEVSKRLKIQLDEGASMKAINKTLAEKKELTKKFENLSGLNWRL
tara:strand:- start:101 stop:352 length:252 start_codon:yes stop_codon:yes gene_type:complete